MEDFPLKLFLYSIILFSLKKGCGISRNTKLARYNVTTPDRANNMLLIVYHLEVVSLKTETPALIRANSVAPLDAEGEARMSRHVIDPECQ